MFTKHPVLSGTIALLLIALVLTLIGNVGAGRAMLAFTVLFVPIALVWNLVLDRFGKRR